MDLTNIPLFGGLAKKMDWLNQRQSVLAGNIANADTPGYRPSDLKDFNFDKAVEDAGKLHVARRTHPNHLGGAAADIASSRIMEDKTPYEVSPSGNAVVLEEQMIKASQTAIDYQTATNLYGRSLNLVRMALGGNGR